MRWFEAVCACEAAGEPYALATVIAVSGSTPRDTDGKMVVTADASHDTLGGGQLEALVTERARGLLADRQPHGEIRHFPLAAAAQQCCGGSVTVLIEPFGTRHMNVHVFGAGHVGARVVTLLEELPARVTWIDSRAGRLDPTRRCRRLERPDPVDAVADLEPGSHVLVLTHDHQLDYRIVSAVLRRGAWGSLGLIGSDTKWQRFRARLLRDGFAAADVERVRCPVGLAMVPGKQPMAVAVAIVGELLGLAAPGPSPQRSALTWRQVKAALLQEAIP